jgi:hypothetical protein
MATSREPILLRHKVIKLSDAFFLYLNCINFNFNTMPYLKSQFSCFLGCKTTNKVFIFKAFRILLRIIDVEAHRR